MPSPRRLVELAIRILPACVLASPGVAFAQAAPLPPPPPPIVVVQAPVPPAPPPVAPPVTAGVVLSPPPEAPPPGAILVVPPPPPPEFTGPAGERLDEARFTDANSDHVILGLTAETNPKGTFYISDYEILLPQVGYAITDSLQVSVTALPPYFKNQPYFFDFGLKLNVIRRDVFRAALVGGLDILVDPDATSNGTAVGAHFAGIGQFCFEKTCRSSVAVNVGTFINNQSNDLVPVYGTAGVTIGVSKLVSLLVEPGVGGIIGSGQFDGDGGSAFFLDYGIRLSGEHFGFDLALVRPFGSGSDPLIIGYPWVGFTYRTSGSARTPPPPAAVSMAMAR